MADQTASEKYLASLCRKAFLSLWSYPSLYTDEGRKGGKGHGRELCDLLVVFGNDVLIFSDKHIQFKDTGNIEVDWPRWHKKAVIASINQLYGAEKWLTEHPGRIFLDRECRTPFPLPLPKPAEIHFHRIAVTRGSYSACEAFFRGKSIGSLRLSSEKGPHSLPFTVGTGHPNKPFVHIFDEHSLDIIFEQLDTVFDFVAYLRKKEQFLTRDGMEITTDGEEQLLAFYLRHMNAAGDHDLELPANTPADLDFAYIPEGEWEEVRQSAQLAAKKEANKVSYFWDHLIEKFISIGDPNIVAHNLDQKPGDEELALRVMAGESRFSRRLLATSYLDTRSRSGPTQAYARVSPLNVDSPSAYVFLAEPVAPHESYADYRKFRLARLSAYCLVATLKSPNAKQIVGIAVDSRDPSRKGVSEDLWVLEVRDRAALETDARATQSELGILLDENIREIRYHDDEYPTERLGYDLESAKSVPTHSEASKEVEKQKKKRERNEKSRKKMQKESKRRNSKKK